MGASTTEFDFDVSQMTFGAGITQALGTTVDLRPLPDYVQETIEPTECASVECVDIESSGLNVGVTGALFLRVVQRIYWPGAREFRISLDEINATPPYFEAQIRHEHASVVPAWLNALFTSLHVTFPLCYIR